MDILNLYYVDMKLIRDYSKIDENVFSVSPQINKQNRPFLGVIIIQGGRKYCIPLSSPKNKHRRMKSSVDMIKIFDESERGEDNQFKLIGILNLNNMIPVDDRFISKIDLSINKNDTDKQKKYKELLIKQIKWCRSNSKIIVNKSNKLYKMVTEMPDKNINLTRRTVDFKKLEDKLDKLK